MEEATEENPEVKGVEQSPHQPLFVSYCKVESIVSYFFERSIFVGNIVRLQAELALLSVGLSKPLDQARFMNVFECSFALANLLQQRLIFDKWGEGFLSLVFGDSRVVSFQRPGT